MKIKFTFIIAAMLLVLSLVGCDLAEFEIKEPPIDSSDGELTEKQLTYKDIACVESKGYKTLYFCADNNDNIALGINLPKEWTVKKNSEGRFDILRSGSNIGFISLEPVESVKELECEFTKDTRMDEIESTRSIYKLAEMEYIHYFTYSYELDGNTRNVYIYVKYEELDDFSANKVLYNTSRELISTAANMGSAMLSSDIIQRGANIKIIGNSFIGTSDIGNILRDMCRGQHNVNAQSIGMGTVSKNYSVDSQLLYELESGQYDALFLCGFYNHDDAAAISPIIDACRASETKLFVFPAHNEYRTAVEIAAKNEYVELLDWKNEIDMLIESGVDYDDFCVNDYYKHSTPLAGYVGAHMIYRTLFGTIPPALSSYGDLDQSYITSKLGEYATTGNIENLSESEIYRF